MKGDFSRISFDAKNHFSRVLLQQGRVTLDADPNEQGAILLHYLRTLARDIIGPCGGPVDDLGFQLTLDTSGAANPVLKIGAGRYYVDGILVENDAECDYAYQPDRTPPDDPLLQWLKKPNGDMWLYLDVWERHVSWIEDDAIREPALGGPDTCTRAKVVWQVRGVARDTILDRLKSKRDAIDGRLKLKDPILIRAQQGVALQAQLKKLDNDVTLLTPKNGVGGNDCAAPLDSLDGLSDAQMTARLDPGQQIKDPCVLAPDAQYRGVENQLYRVEIHCGGVASTASTTDVANTATFKWSRDNGSVATRWLGTEGKDLVVANARGFTAGAWVELSDESHELLGQPGLLVKLAKVEGDRLRVDLNTIPADASIALTREMINAKVRRWDQTETDDITLDGGAVPLVEASATAVRWIDLEDGIQVQFTPGGSYRSGDYWLIPARVATGSIEWPNTVSAPGAISWQAQPPKGVEHHYAPLAFLGLVSGKLSFTPCLCTIDPINSCSRVRNFDAIRINEARKPPVKPKLPPPAKPK